MSVGAETLDGALDFRTASSFEDASEATVEVDPDHELAMMFTSGTTGVPKAVLHTHGSIDGTALGNGMSYFVEKEDNYVLFLPLYHSGTMFLWAPFYATGATGTILREFTDPAWILEAIAEEGGTDTLFVVPIAIALLNALDAGHVDISRYDLTRWKYLEIGAQPVPFDVLKGLVEKLPCGVSNIYGITEGGGGGTFNLYPADVLRKPGSIGRPTFGVEARIVDDAGNQVSVGEVGELTFRTPRMMKEYFHNTQLTAKALEQGWLRTGDVVRMDDEGYFYIVDRKKDMICSGGREYLPGRDRKCTDEPSEDRRRRLYRVSRPTARGGRSRGRPDEGRGIDDPERAHRFRQVVSGGLQSSPKRDLRPSHEEPDGETDEAADEGEVQRLLEVEPCSSPTCDGPGTGRSRASLSSVPRC